ncbi:MAG: right-handed parallel beta-helix repeat-containing protein [Candidatus Pseudobacter hemicellulosilyticus]|uniref:Right-handed parallel beta-helix repeat-containing protein n=1 Tax=Candidatus Pseudobacter hemicellulosilyticus TaxID=3121375 RepID=A0AAJ5WQQ2_9BACT|nr:MAG: right-handed parallel beta-helix repeat-containing protein [Pseudobacter sp.]
MRTAFLCLFAGCFATVLKGQTLYVSPDGGSETFSQLEPGSLKQLPQKIRHIRQQKQQPIVIYLKGGIYPMDQPLQLHWETDPRDSSIVLLASAPKERAVLSGGIVISNWTAASKGIYTARVPAGLSFRQLYVDGQLAVRARYPNRINDTDLGPYFRVARFDVPGQQVITAGKEIPVLTSYQGVEMVMNQHWYQSRVRIAGVERRKDSAVLRFREPEAPIFWGMTSFNMHLPDKPYYLENHLNFVDTANEWFLDEPTATLYYKPGPGRDIGQLSIVVPVLETLLQVGGSGARPLRNLTIQNIDFMYSSWLMPSRGGSIATQAAQQRQREDSSGTGLVQVQFASNLRIIGCRFAGAGAHGLVFSKGVQNSIVSGNHFEQISANGMVIDTDKKPFQPDSIHCTRNKISDNLIEAVGLHYTNGMGILASNVSRHTIEYNEIRNSRYMGMQIGNHYGDNLSRLRDNIIRHNNIHQVMLLHDDGGAIYTLSNQPGTKILRNWIHDYGKSIWADSYPVNGIFLDNNSSYIQVQDNVFSKLKMVDQLKENTGTTVHDNIFINNTSQDPEVKEQAGIRKR